MKPSVAEEEPAQQTDDGRRFDWRDWRSLPPWAWPLAALALLVVIVVAVELWQYGTVVFLRPENLRNVLSQQSYVGIVAVGMTFVIVAGGIDLSVGSLLALCGVVCLFAGNAAGGGWATLLSAAGAALGAGAAAGLLHGLLVAKGKVAAFVVTLGGLAAYRSLALTFAGSGEVRDEAGGDLFAALANGGIPIPGTDLAARNPDVTVPLTIVWPILVFLAVAAVGAIVLNRTRFGRYAVAVGANERAASYGAVPVDAVKIGVFVLLGALTGLAALLSASRTQSISSGGTGTLLELDAIAAVVVGGTRLSGGRGTMAGTVLGVLILGVIGNMLTLLQVEAAAQGLVKGAVIVLAVLVQRKT